ncbi:hypothetical protein PUN28_002558 [Cardiocondyla obscurior]|uniref:Uncharacterized protein n=1 Tax=Cardiocondyla obscurior TaxID=286306 RepID=A0AAW2GUS7_9HYME
MTRHVPSGRRRRPWKGIILRRSNVLDHHSCLAVTSLLRINTSHLRGGGGLGKASCFGGATFWIIIAALL